MTDYTLKLEFSTDETQETIQAWIDEALLSEMPEGTTAILSRDDWIVSIDELVQEHYGRTLSDPKGNLPTAVLEGAYPLKTHAEGHQYGLVLGGKLYHASGFDVVKVTD